MVTPTVLEEQCEWRGVPVPLRRLRSMRMEPGDMQFVNNYHVLHARAAHTDDREAGSVRHLKRLWLETSFLTDDDKPEAFRMGGTTEDWWKAASQ